ncbi:hypothetical protein K440DRAFT_393601 [Wilcoxina mikolae CBS 423.85]|nr:hypothetical protein K440DRAFT_393601 [Wilcoxina mikolae CBS 423.85]
MHNFLIIPFCVDCIGYWTSSLSFYVFGISFWDLAFFSFCSVLFISVWWCFDRFLDSAGSSFSLFISFACNWISASTH